MVVGKSRRDRAFDVLNFIFLTVLTAGVVYPLAFVVFASMSSPFYVGSGKVILWPRGFTLGAYDMVVREPRVWQGYLNTVFYVAVDIGIGLAVILPVSYALSRPNRLKGAGAITFLIAFTMLFSGGLIPLYLVVRGLGMLNTVWAVTIPGTVSAFLIIITRTFLKTTLPQEMYDAAEIDGASFAQTFFRVVLPLSAAIIAVLALFVGIGQWNAFFPPLLYLTDRDKYPLQLVLRNILLADEALGSMVDPSMDLEALEAMARRQERATTMKYALIVVSSAPVLVLYPFLQRHLMKGVMLGSIKG